MCHVLMIEDEPLIAMELEQVLAAAGATSFDFACSQEEAVTAAAARLPAFITSDVTLLEGTGPLAVSVIRRQLGHIPVVFITGTPDACHPCDQANRILVKPYSRSLLVEALRDLAGCA